MSVPKSVHVTDRSRSLPARSGVAVLGVCLAAALLAAVPAGAFDAPVNPAPGDSSMVSDELFGGFGYELATGDVDADGNLDLLVLTPNVGDGDGMAVDIYLGSSGTPFNETALYNDGSVPAGSDPDIQISGMSPAYSGWGMGVGDFDDNGIPEIAIATSGGVEVFDTPAPGIHDLGDLSPTTVTNPGSGDAGPLAVGDLTDNGVDDLLIGWPGDDEVTIHYGASPVPSVTIIGESGSSFGASVALGHFIGDADGFADVAVGARDASVEAPAGGAVYGFEDAAAGSSTLPFTGAAIRLTGGNGEALLGAAVLVDDVNSDGADDLISGAPGGDNGIGGLGYVSMALGPLAPGIDSDAAAFDPYANAAVPSLGSFLAAGDVDGSGDADLAMAGFEAVAVLSDSGEEWVFEGVAESEFGSSIAIIPNDVMAVGAPSTLDYSGGSDPAGSVELFATAEPVGGGDLVVDSAANVGDFFPGDGDCASSEGFCTLRAAIEEANASGGGDITFDIPGAGPHVITPTSPLPVITAPVTIDGSTQPGNGDAFDAGGLVLGLRPLFDLGPDVDGLVFAAGSDGSSIRGLAISAFSGTALRIQADDVTVLNMRLGVRTSDVGSVANQAGLSIEGTNALIEHNLISNNTNVGVDILATGAVLRDNRIGTSIDGEAARPNDIGINVGLLTGLTDIDGNVISGNATVGLQVKGSTVLVRSNRIGVSPTGAAVGNGAQGILVAPDGVDAADGTIGGNPLDAANIISHNGDEGIALVGDSTFVIAGNSISDNGGLGIDLGLDGVTPNDSGDADTGPNDLLNAPEISDVILAGAGSAANLVLDVPTGDYRLQLFANAACDPSGAGEGAHFVSSFDATVSGPNAQVLVPFDEADLAGDTVLTATVTSRTGFVAIATSEFSPCVSVVDPSDAIVSNLTLEVDVDTTGPGITGVPIADIPIDAVLDASTESAEAAAPLSAVPLSAVDLGSTPLSAVLLSAVPLSAVPLSAVPLSAVPLSAVGVEFEGGWTELLVGTSQEGRPPVSVDLGDLLAEVPSLPPSHPLQGLTLAQVDLASTPLSAVSTMSIMLGDLDLEAELSVLCDDANAQGVVCDSSNNTLLGLELAGYDVSAAPLSAVPLSAVPLSAVPLSAVPLSAVPLSAVPLSAVPLSAVQLEGTPLSAVPLSAVELGSIPLSAVPLSAVPLSAVGLDVADLAGTALAEVALADLSSERGVGCEILVGHTDGAQALDCEALGLDDDSSLGEAADAFEDRSASLAASPLSAVPLSAVPLSAVPLSAVPLSAVPLSAVGLGPTPLSVVPLSAVTFEGDTGCAILTADAFDCDDLGLGDDATLLELSDALAAESASYADSRIAQAPLSAVDFTSVPLSAVPLSAVPLSAVPLSAVDLAGTPLSAVPLSAVTFEGLTGCERLEGHRMTIDGETVDLDCAALGIDDTATLYDVAVLLEAAGTSLAASPLSAVPLSAVPLSAVDLGLEDATLATLFGEDANLDDLPESVLEQLDLLELLFILAGVENYPWEDLDLVDLGVQDFVPGATTVTYTATFDVADGGPVRLVVELPRGYRYRDTSSSFSGSPVLDPAVSERPEGQVLTWTLDTDDGVDQTLAFDVSPGFEITTSTSDARVAAANVVEILDAAPHTVTPVDGNDFVDPDVLQIGYVTDRTETDLYTIASSGPGNELSVFLGHQSTDVDLVLYRPLTALPEGSSEEGEPAGPIVEDDGPGVALSDGIETETLGDVPLDPNASVAEASSDRGVGTETAATTDLDGGTSYRIQVSGYNDAVSPEPYLLRVVERPEVPIPVCAPVPGRPAAADLASSGALPAGLESIVVFDLGRAVALHGAAGAATMEAAAQALVDELNALATFGSAALLYTDPFTDYAAWDANPCDWRAADEVADAIRTELTTYAADNESLDYVTIIGGDDLIPMHRQTDATAYANEAVFASEYGPETNPALYGAFTTRHLLTDHPYGDPDPVRWLDRWLYVPEIAVGRLVESPAEVAAAVRTFTDFDGMLDTSTGSYVTGYDFLTDGATETADILGGDAGFDLTTDISENWTDDDVEAQLSAADRATVLSINAHFDPYRALPAAEQTAGEDTYTDTTLFQTSDLSGVDLERAWLFTMGCHAGVSESDVTFGRSDWAQNFVGGGGALMANTGFGYGDTATVALSEELVVGIARNLRPSYWTGPRSIGHAFVDSFNDYYGGVGLYGVYDEKALQEFTLYGLPMYQFESGVTTEGTEQAPGLTETVDGFTGGPAATTTIDEPLIEEPDDKGTFYSADGQTLEVHYRPIQPMTTYDVTLEGLTARGALILDWTSTDVEGVTNVAYARPVIDDGDREAEIEDPDALFPSTFAHIAAYERTSPLEGSRTEERQNLNLILGQYDATTDTQRLFGDVDVQVLYVADDAVVDDVPASISTVQSAIVDDQVSFIVDIDDGTEASRVVVLYRAIGSSDWQSADLQANSPWSGSAPVPSGTDEVEFLVQAVRDNGLVSTSSSKGEFHRAEPLPTELPASEELTVTIDGTSAAGWYTGSVTIAADGTAGPFTATVDGSPVALPTTIGDSGAHVVVITDAEGEETTFVVPIDNAAPEVSISLPSAVDQGEEVPIAAVCRDAGSGLASCTVTVDGAAVDAGSLLDTSTPGVRSVVVAATDRVGNASSASATVEVVGVVEPTIEAELDRSSATLDDPVTVQATVSDATVESWTVDWGDGTVDTVEPETSELTLAHTYDAAGSYDVTVTAAIAGGDELEAVAGSVAVHDLGAHRLSGAGQFTSPAGSWTEDPADRGRTTFALDLRYRNGSTEPSGTFVLRFARADLTFVATDWDWLLTDAGSLWQGGSAVAEGTGRIRHRSGEVQVRIEATDTGIGWWRDRDDLRVVLTDATSGEVLYDSGVRPVRGAVVLVPTPRRGHR